MDSTDYTGHNLFERTPISGFRLKDVLTYRGVFGDPKMKLLSFTEHKDTLDFLTGDGKEGRSLGELVKWGLPTFLAIFLGS
jgi:hypothetical protein